MAYNTILIKRRPFSHGVPGAPSPGSLSAGELAFNEVDSTLYFESSLGTLAIAGSGSYVDRTTDQTISGNKTFTGSTALSTTTWSAGSTLDFGGNVLGNIGAPSLSSDAATKQYVDDNSASLGSSVQTLSTEIYNNFVEKVESEAVTLNGGLTVSAGLSTDTLYTSSDAGVGGNLTVTGNLSVYGTQTVINTETVNISGVSTQIDIINDGTGTGITVNQTGEKDVAEFKDDGVTALIVKGLSSTPGYVGINTDAPNERLTVSGNISASGTIYSAGGMEISAGAGATTLYVEDGKVGINTETPNEEFTVFGDISASANIYGLDIYARNGDFTGTMDIDGATTLGSTLSVVNTVDFDSTLTVDGLVTINNSTTTTGNISGSANTSYIVDFIIDGGVF